MSCEQCSNSIPPAEYGVHIGEQYWRAIAPRPNNEYFQDGLLCIDCMDGRLHERLGVCILDAYDDGGYLVVKGWPTDRMLDILVEEDYENLNDLLEIGDANLVGGYDEYLGRLRSYLASEGELVGSDAP